MSLSVSIGAQDAVSHRSISPLGFIYNPENRDSNFLRNGDKPRDVIHQTQWPSQTTPWELRHGINVITTTTLIYLAPTLEEAFKAMCETLQRKLPPWKCSIIINSVGCKKDHQTITGVWIGGEGGSFERRREHPVKLQKIHPLAWQLLSIAYRSLLQPKVYPSPHNNSPPLN